MKSEFIKRLPLKPYHSKKVATMTLPEIKRLFLEKLNHLYPETEIHSFFHLLLEHHFGTRKVDLALEPELLRKEWPGDVFLDGLAELEQERPIQYIIGSTEFAGMTFRANENVLIPRPETEELVWWILETVDDKPSLKILDIGTGSGCIPVSLALKLPGAEVHALDVSKEALELASDNALRLGAEVNFFELDILTAENLTDHYDVMVSNPPYVRLSEKNEMRGNVLKYEPDLALFVNDEDPLLFYRRIASLGRDSLNENGMLFFEINENLSEKTQELLSDLNFRDIEVKKDIYGKNRMIRAFKK
jgi:release factor glutamine methyltransferase